MRQTPTLTIEQLKDLESLRTDMLDLREYADKHLGSEVCRTIADDGIETLNAILGPLPKLGIEPYELNSTDTYAWVPGNGSFMGAMRYQGELYPTDGGPAKYVFSRSGTNLILGYDEVRRQVQEVRHAEAFWRKNTGQA